MPTDASILLDDGVMELKLGAQTISVRPLCIEPSGQWVRRVRAAWMALSNDMRGLMDAAKADNMDAVTATLQGVAGFPVMIARDLLNEHSPSVLTLDILGTATSQQIVTAFEKVYLEENPLARLAAVMMRT